MAKPKGLNNKRSLSTYLSYIGNFALAAMMLLCTADVTGRYFFNAPVLGAYEITEYLMLIMVFSYLASAQSAKIHIRVDIVYDLVPLWLQGILDRINHLVCLLMMILVSWKSIQHTWELQRTGEQSLLLKIPDYPFAIFLVIGCLIFCLEFLKDVLGSTETSRKSERS